VRVVKRVVRWADMMAAPMAGTWVSRWAEHWAHSSVECSAGRRAVTSAAVWDYPMAALSVEMKAGWKAGA
jgi:hypothetical protein